METINHYVEAFSSFIWGWPMVIMLLGTHLYLTFILKFPQRKLLKAIKLSVTPDKKSTGDVSQFGALATALAATIGTGNIVGVATAIAIGGPGAVFWCWLTGVFGIATKYSEGLLAIKYRVKTASGSMLGGPMYALERGLGWKKMAMLFSLFTAFASFGIGSTVQANAISTITNQSYAVSPWFMGAIICILTGFVINGLVVAGLFPAVRLLLFSLRSLRFGCCLGLFLQRVDDYRNSCCSARFRFHFAVCCAQVPLRRNCLRQRNDPDPSGFRKRHGRLAGVDGTGFPAILQHAELTGQPDGHLRSVRRGPHAAKVDSERGDSRGRHGDHPADQHHDKQTGNKPFSQIHFQKGLPEA